MELLNTLNDKQKAAALSLHKRVLVLAGAGSGKTKTVISKIVYLISAKHVAPSNILSITFTRNAANEMIDRLIISGDETGKYEKIINDKNITPQQKDAERRKRKSEQPWINALTIKTFHSLCYQILRDHGNPVFDSKFKLLTEEGVEFVQPGDSYKGTAVEKPHDIIHKLLIELCNDRDYMLNLKRYILDYYVDKLALDKEVSKPEYRTQRTYTTLRGETVKSKSERDIADWLYRHNINYVYEVKVDLKDFPFHPDFYIPQANLFLEHKSDLSYKTEDKEKQFTQAGRNFVITYESMMNNSGLFNLAMERIVMGKLTQNITAESALKYEEEFKTYGDKINEFLRTVMRLQSMVKAEGIELDSLLPKSSINPHERVRVFYELSLPLIKSYKTYCVNKSYLDFDDLVVMAIELLKKQEDIRTHYRSRFKYILVDEFQDVNSLQVQLLDLLLTPESQLFCVGDDWQSIYGFRGSNVDFIVNFEKHYPGSEVHKLDVNYRSSQSIVGASNEIIKNNKNQIAKDVRAAKNTLNKINIFRAKRMDIDGVSFFTEQVQKLFSQGYTKDDILVLYRRNKMFKPFYEALKELNLRVSGKTIHASKGLEARAVFIIGLTHGNGGFPDVWLDDAIFRVVKDVKHDMLLEEERRLFYVAVTRAKEELYLFTELGNESAFIDEIPDEYFQANKVQFLNGESDFTECVKCKTIINKQDNFCRSCGVKQAHTNSNPEKAGSVPTYIQEARLKFPNAYAPWSDEEDQLLIGFWKQSLSKKEIGERLKRNPGAISARVKKLGLEE